MNNLEDFFKGLLIENERESAISKIVEEHFAEATTQAEEVGNANDSYVGVNTYFVFDPFPFLIFDNTGNGLSATMVNYYTQALEDYNKHKDTYRTLKVLPSFIKDTLQCTIFSRMTRTYVNAGYANDVKGIDVIKRFYGLKSDEIGNDFYSQVGSWHKLKDLIEKNPGNRLFTPVDMVSGAKYLKLNSPNVAYAKGIYMEYDLKTLPVMNLLATEAEKFKQEEESLDSKVKPKTEYEKYAGFLIAASALNSTTITSEVEKVRSMKSFSSNTPGLNKNFDRANYKNPRLSWQSTDIDYWKDTAAGKAVDWLNKNACGDCENWQKAVDALSHTFNRTKLDQDLEKFYNKKHFLPDVLGLESDSVRYDARKYEDPMRRKIKGVSGYDIYKNDKKIQDLNDDIDDAKKEISIETDPDKIKKLEKRIEDDEKEIEIIEQKLESAELKSDRTEELYKKKIKKANATDGNLQGLKFSKGIAFVKNHASDLSIMNKYLSNQ